MGYRQLTQGHGEENRVVTWFTSGKRDKGDQVVKLTLSQTACLV